MCLAVWSLLVIFCWPQLPYHEVGVRPSQARLGPARLVSIREKKLGKARLGAGSKIFGSIVARLEIGSKNFGSQLGSARSDLARWLASQT